MRLKTSLAPHLSESSPRELAPATILRILGCRGFLGPVPPPLSMSAIRNESGTARQLQHDYEGIAIPPGLPSRAPYPGLHNRRSLRSQQAYLSAPVPPALAGNIGLREGC